MVYEAPPSRSIVPEPNISPDFKLDEIQGDIFPTFPKKVESLVFFIIKDKDAFRKALGELIPHVSTAAKVLGCLSEIKQVRTQHGVYSQAPMNSSNDTRPIIPMQFIQVALSQSGLLDMDPTIGDALRDPHFEGGQLAEAVKDLKDKVDPSTNQVYWENVWKDNNLHGVIVIACESEQSRHESLQLVHKIFGNSIHTVNILTGHARAGGKEHFGFTDGISQPAMKGLVLPHAGQPQCDPGVIIMGEKGDAVQENTTTGVKHRPHWTDNGSFMVVRKLRQLVPEFNQFLAQNPIQLPGLTHQEAVALTGAKMVGRWHSGAPTDLTPFKDDLTIANDPEKNNNFHYDTPSKGELRCPFAAHIRKMVPRLEVVPQQLISFMVRAGIPYGPEVTEEEQENNTTVEDRGLIFVSYQSSIDQSFHKLQEFWANNPTFPPPAPGEPPRGKAQPGLDPVIATGVQDEGSVAPPPPKVSGLNPQNTDEEFNPRDFVIARGGEYFFVPSISTLKAISEGQVLGGPV